jgi:hypothetical protein
MGKYLHSEGRTEQRGRPEDGVPGLKKKWQDWPGMEKQQQEQKGEKPKKEKSK